jgi:hypothetical protein
MKKKNKSLKVFRKLHKWPGIVIAFLAVLFALSGIVMNHRPLFSKVDVSRNLLPSDYHYKNWNLAAVRGGLALDSTSYLFFGNVGIWQKNGEKISDFNLGFPTGIDQRKIYQIRSFQNKLYAATHFGLYQRPVSGGKWEKIKLPLKEERLADLFIKQDSLMILSRHYLLKSADGIHFETVQLPAPEGYVRETGLFNTLWQLHSGELFGLAGKLAVDLLGLVTILLSVTGLLHFFFPKIAKRRREKQKDNSKLNATKRLNLRWHNVVGYIFILFLIINTIAGMFLRPPLLIPIAYTKVGLIPGTHLDSPNPWFDKLRRATWNDEMKSYLFSTSEGFYLADETLKEPVKRLKVQPPISVMGCNVLEQTGPMKYLVGSFSGLFIWDIKKETVFDAFTLQPPNENTGRPISGHMVTGYFDMNGKEHYLFEYDKGMLNFEGLQNWEMPEDLLQKSPMSLWNAALEIHTGRIFEHLLGPFYILYVPLSGLCLLMVLISGFLIWWKAYRKKKNQSIEKH